MSKLDSHGLPSDVSLEGAVLGAGMLDEDSACLVDAIPTEHFTLEAHRRIHSVFKLIRAKGAQADRITIASELMSAGALESVGGLTYLVSLDNELPRVYALESYIRRLAGIAAAREAAIVLARATDDVLSGDLEALERAEVAIGGLLERGRKTGGGGMMRLREWIAANGGVDEFLRPRRGSGAITPWPDLAEVVPQIDRGELCVIGAPPGVGKSQIACQWALAVAHASSPVPIFSLEMSSLQLWRRIVALQARRAPDAVSKHMVQIEPVSAIADLPLYIPDLMSQTIASIRQEIRQANRLHQLGLVVVDYLQLVEAKGSNRVEAVGQISRGLKTIARECGVPVLALSQLSRDSQRDDDRPPRLSDLRESGAIEQDADIVMFPWMCRKDRAVMYESRSPMPIEMIVAKQRNGPAGIKVPMIWNFPLARLESRSR